MLKSFWLSLTAVVWLVMCAAFVAALATWATASEPLSVASWRPAGVMALRPGPDDLRAPVSLQTWRPAAAVTGPPVSLSSWRPVAHDVAPPPLTIPKPPSGPFASYCVGGQCYQSPQQMTPKAWRQWKKSQH